MAFIVVTITGVPEDRQAAFRPLLEAGHEVRFDALGASAPRERIVSALRGAAGILAQTERYDAGVFDGLPDLKIVARVGVGYDAVDLAAATAHGVAVTVSLGANDWAVADQTFGVMIALCRQIVPLNASVREGRWERPMTTDFFRKTLGLVGLGRVGRGMVERAAGFELKVLACEPYPDLEYVRAHDVELVSLEELLRRSDFVSLHLPATPETHHLMNAERLALMKPTAFLVNTSRGSLVDEAALEAALKAKRIGGAALDVREVEPARDSRFSRFPNVILTPHMAGITKETIFAMCHMAAQSVADHLAGRRPHGLVNPEVL